MYLSHCTVLVSLLGLAAHADTIVYQQPSSPVGELYQSSWWSPDDSDYDQWVWDDFTLPLGHAITEVTWRGGYIYGGMDSNSVADFSVSIYASIAANSQPDVVGGPLVTYETGGNAGQTPAGMVGGVAMYDYHFVLPAPFQAAAGTRYWVQIEAWQEGLPEWGIASGTGGNSNHFRWLRGAHMYQSVPGDTAFALLAADAGGFTITASAAPAGAGSVQGAGIYPVGSTASLVALPAAGFGFLEWTDGGVQVSTAATYNFTVTGDRTLVAHFVPAYSISTSASPSFGGITTGEGTFNSGTDITVTATANSGYVFVDWTWFGSTVSTSPIYSFIATMDMPLVAHFAPEPLTVTFDLDNAPIHTSLPIDLTVGGLAAHFTGTDGSFSIQRADTMGFTPAGFAGLCLYPSSVFRADLHVSFSAPLTDFSILYSPQELGCDDSATMRVTAYQDGVFVATQTTTAPTPGNWPTGTLSISAAAGFNSVAVHYESRPPTCQDYGVIFLADNMTVRRAPAWGDLNADGVIDLIDYVSLAPCLGGPAVNTAPLECDPAVFERCDLNFDGAVDMADFALLQSLIPGQ